MKKRKIIGFFLFTFLLLLSACSGSGSGGQESTSPSLSSVTEQSSAGQAQSSEKPGNGQTPEARPGEAKKGIRLLALKGPTAMGLASLVTSKRAEDQALIASFTLAQSPQEALTAFIRGEADIATLPANQAALLYQKLKGDLAVLNINTLGNLYVVERQAQVTSLADLKGKKLYAAGKGATPEIVLTELLDWAEVPEDDRQVVWLPDHTAVLQKLLQEKDALAFLPEPFVSLSIHKNPQIHPALELNLLWDQAQAGQKHPARLVMGVTIARREWIKAHPDLVKAFQKAHFLSIDQANSDPAEAAKKVEALGILKRPIAERAIPYASLVCLTDETMKEGLSGFLRLLYENNPKFIGGALPGPDFYYHSEK